MVCMEQLRFMYSLNSQARVQKTHCITLQRTLQRTATHCNTLQHKPSSQPPLRIQSMTKKDSSYQHTLVSMTTSHVRQHKKSRVAGKRAHAAFVEQTKRGPRFSEATPAPYSRAPSHTNARAHARVDMY